jgi:transcriptional regulator with XRE-family HTH domain
MNPIKKIRKANDLTRNELSLLLNLPYSTLTEVENTNYNNPKNVIEKLADVFDVDEDLLIRDYNECREEKRKELMNKIK